MSDDSDVEMEVEAGPVTNAILSPQLSRNTVRAPKHDLMLEEVCVCVCVYLCVCIHVCFSLCRLSHEAVSSNRPSHFQCFHSGKKE